MEITFDDWLAGGSRIPIDLPGGRRDIFVRTAGPGQWCTLVHGFPTSSADWAPLWGDLTARRRVLAFDLLGFGDSDKPDDHDYTIHEQADLTEALWRHHGITQTALVAHDYGVSVAQELLARQQGGSLAATITNVVFLNGGLYPELHRPLPGQLALLDPELGPQVGRMLGEETFAQSMRATYGRQPTDALLHQQWLAVSRRDGHRIGHRLIQYIRDRAQHTSRWVTALETATVPRAFVWGMLDPVSGAHMAERIAERMPDAPLLQLADVGHWPQLEASDLVRLELRTHVA
ncbi:MAG TPA: alpha/beta hydrolase [Candidatus Binatia bacterium]|jgi:pimeloyl-ACP methyl ester carboxylesterase|nr:alpha/beta hydrolase [Candidatus Binatia bacterium]